MSISSTEGSITLSREWPHPSAINDSQLTGLRIFVNEQGFWTGDRVTLTAPGGLPFDILSTGYANCPDGHGFWPSSILGPAAAHRTNDAAPFFGADDALAFFDTAASTGLTTTFDAYLRRDGLDRCTFYTSEIAAVNGGATGLLPIIPVEFGTLVIANTYNNTAYRALLADAATKLFGVTLTLGQQAIDDLPQVADESAAIAFIADSTDVRGWKIQCDLADVLFDEDSGNLDSAAIGEEFGSAAPGIATGQGSFRGELGNDWDTGEHSAIMMLRLLRMKRKGSSATARIQIAKSRIVKDGSTATRQEFPIYYETKILFGKTTVGITAQQNTTFSGDFISVGDIEIVTDPIEVA